MLIVGLTGGIGSGKSTASNFFAELGVTVIDADQIAHDLVAAGQPALETIKHEFGPEIITQQGELDRARTRQIIFSDPKRRKALESILHPLIHQEMQQRVKNIDAPYCVLSIPLLVETGKFDLVDRVLLIDTPKSMQLSRIKQRDDILESEINSIVNSQATREQRHAVADDIILNDEDIDKLEEHIKQLHNKYLSLASNE